MDPRSGVFILRAQPARFVLLLLWSPVVVGIASCPQHLPDCFCCCGPSPQLFLLVLLVRASLHLLPIFAALVFFLPFLIISSFNSFFFLKRFLLPHRFLCQLLCILPIFASSLVVHPSYAFVSLSSTASILSSSMFSQGPSLYAFRPGFLSTKKIIAGDIFQRRNFQGCRQPISSRLQPLKLRIHHDAFVCDGIPKEKLYEFSTVNTCRRAKKE